MTHLRWRIAARLLPPCLLIACQEEATTPTASPATFGEVSAAVTDNVVASLIVIPDTQMVFVGDQFQILAQSKNKAGQVLDKSVAWTVANAQVIAMLGPPQATMTFKALRTGKTSAKATVDAKSRFSIVVVRAVAGAGVVVTPAEATVASGDSTRFMATGLTPAGETAGVNVTWTATGGAISAGGVLKAGDSPGIYRVIAISAFGAADTSVVTVTGGAPSTAPAVILVPVTATVAAGATVQFDAYGRTDTGDSVAVPVTYTGTGGTITGAGLYAAGQTPGTFRVIATSAAGNADTSAVTISAAPTGRVTLMPDVAASRGGEKTQFVASVLNTLGDIVPASVTYGTTCGTVTATGIFTAPPDGTGTCLVTAAADGKADTTEVVLLTNNPNLGIPFGIYDLWTSPTITKTSGIAALSASHDYMAPSEIVSHISAARAKGIHVVLAMTGASHDRYKTAGVFDMAKWRAAMDGYNTASIRSAVADGVADGTIIGNSVMDEPQQSGTDGKAWGPAGTMTKKRVDSLCAYVKAVFPTLPAGVGHDHSAFQPDSSYRVCEFLITQYALRKGNLNAWRDAALALAERDGMEMVFSINLLDGGAQDKNGAWDCPGTGGLGTRSPNCRMTSAQVRDWGKVLGRAGCAMLSWRYDATFVAKPENQAALSDVAITLSSLPRTPCTAR